MFPPAGTATMTVPNDGHGASKIRLDFVIYM